MKILNILTILAITLNISVAKAESCDSGTIAKGSNGHEYCITKDMNWWSAYTWCEAQGRHLASMYEICPNWDGSTGVGKCDNLISNPYGACSATAKGDTNVFCVTGFSSKKVDTNLRSGIFAYVCY